VQLWSRHIQDSHYRVTGAGRTVRLYTNGVFHSQFNPGNVFSGALWDCLSLPTLLHAGTTDSYLHDQLRILVLGVGGGAVLKQLRTLHSMPKITGIDIDAVHLRIAKRWFKVTDKNDELIHSDAVKWVCDNASRKFDIIIDDLFGDYHGEPMRSVKMNSQWSSQLVHALAPGGMIVANYIDNQELMHAKIMKVHEFSSAFALRHPAYENVVGIYHTQMRSVNQWRQIILDHPALNVRQRRSAQKLEMRQM